jgi:hypothetical protein
MFPEFLKAAIPQNQGTGQGKAGVQGSGDRVREFSVVRK